MFQENVNGNRTSSAPFVAADGSVWFRAADDDTLMCLKPDGSQSAPGNNRTLSTPFVRDGWVWFQATNNTLMRMKTDGTGLSAPGNNKSLGAPFVTADGWVWFQATNNMLMRMKTDGTGLSAPGNNKSLGAPFVTADGSVWFRGTEQVDAFDHAVVYSSLYRMTKDGTDLSAPGNNKTLSTPFVTADGSVWFRATNNMLMCRKPDGTQSAPGNNKTLSMPLVTAEGWVWFQGADNKLWRMKSDGSEQAQVDGNFTASRPAVGPMTVHAGVAGEWVWFQGTDGKLWRDLVPASLLGTDTRELAYYVLAVVYAPPGRQGGSQSSVDYTDKSSTGTTTSVSASFKDELKVEATSMEAGQFIGGSISAAMSVTDTSSLVITNSQTYKQSMSGPGENGIHHDEDLFLILVNPTVTVKRYPQNLVTWEMGVKEAAGTTQKGAVVHAVHASQLKDPTLLDEDIQKIFSARGLKQSDYDQILSLNPFASTGSGTIDPDRYVQISPSFPYSAPTGPNGASSKYTYEFSKSQAQTSAHEVEIEYSVSMSAGIDKVFKVEDKFTWKAKNTQVKSTSQDKIASVTVGGPAYPYKGPTTIYVYWDTLFSSFMFAFPTDPLSHEGALRDESGQPVAYELVTLSIGGNQFSTFTDGLGEYRFHGTPDGQGTIDVSGHQVQVEVGGPEKLVTHLPRSQ